MKRGLSAGKRPTIDPWQVSHPSGSGADEKCHLWPLIRPLPWPIQPPSGSLPPETGKRFPFRRAAARWWHRGRPGGSGPPDSVSKNSSQVSHSKSNPIGGVSRSNSDRHRHHGPVDGTAGRAAQSGRKMPPGWNRGQTQRNPIESNEIKLGNVSN